MALPKNSYPIFDLEIPSLNKEFKFRPFLVKEEKILLMAQTTSDPREVLLAIRQVINNCFVDTSHDLDVDSLTTFDIEYLFVKLRAKSVNNIINIVYTNPVDGEDYNIEIDLEDVKMVHNPEHNSKIEFSKSTGVIMKYPSTTLMNSINPEMSEAEIFFDLLKYCIDKVYDKNKVYNVSDYTQEEIDEYIQDLSVPALQKIQKFFETMPKLHYEKEYKTKSGEVSKITLNNINDFFQLG